MTEKPPSSMARYAVWYVLALILLLSMFQYYSAMQQAVEISYSEFRHLVQIKGVDDLTVSTDTIAGDLLPPGIEALAKDRQKPDLPQTLAKQFDKKKPIFSTVRLEDPDLVKLLAKDNISYRAVQEKTWLTSLLSWVFPFLLLIGIWVYFFRKK
jgi:cell division protease FtsH